MNSVISDNLLQSTGGRGTVGVTWFLILLFWDRDACTQQSMKSHECWSEYYRVSTTTAKFPFRSSPHETKEMVKDCTWPSLLTYTNKTLHCNSPVHFQTETAVRLFIFTHNTDRFKETACTQLTRLPYQTSIKDLGMRVLTQVTQNNLSTFWDSSITFLWTLEKLSPPCKMLLTAHLWLNIIYHQLSTEANRLTMWSPVIRCHCCKAPWVFGCPCLKGCCAP
jgi:hypothetical protein